MFKRKRRGRSERGKRALKQGKGKLKTPPALRERKASTIMKKRFQKSIGHKKRKDSQGEKKAALREDSLHHTTTLEGAASKPSKKRKI